MSNEVLVREWGGWIAERFGNYTLTAGLLKYEYQGIAGQSFGAFTTQGMELKLIGEANDYVAKGLSGGRLIIVPPEDAAYDTNHSPIVGNVACFGANKGEAYFRGLAGERFCVRNSGAMVVVEGVGDNGCEYMTGGVAVILGKTGRNFAAGMSGGLAYIYDPEKNFPPNCNLEMVELYPLDAQDKILKELIEKHLQYTASPIASEILANWDTAAKDFVKVYPKEFHAVNDALNDLASEGLAGAALLNAAFEKVIGAKKEAVSVLRKERD